MKIIGVKTFNKRYEIYLEKPIDESVESKSPRDTRSHRSHTTLINLWFKMQACCHTPIS